MLEISENTADAFQHPKNVEWVERHARKLKELAPQDVIYFSKDDLNALVGRILTRAESLMVRRENATIAFCYASLKLGVGFETDKKYHWVQNLPKAKSTYQADIIWDNLSESIGRKRENL